MHLLYRSHNFWKVPWKSSCVSVSMAFVTASLHLLNWLITAASELRKYPKVTERKVWTLGTVRSCLDAHLGQIVSDKDGVVDWWIVQVEMPLTRFEQCWPLPTESLAELPWNLNIVFRVDCLSSGNPVHVDHASAVKKRDHQKFVVGFVLSGLLASGRASVIPLGTLALCLWVIAVDPAFILGHQSIKYYGIWIDQLNHLPVVMTTSFFLIFSEHAWDKLCTNLPHLQFLANNCVYSAPLASNCALIVSIDTRRSLFALFIWPINSGVLASLLLPHISSSLTDCLPS